MTKTETYTFSSPDGEVLVHLDSVKGRHSDPKRKLLNSLRNYIYQKQQMNGQKCNKTIIKS